MKLYRLAIQTTARVAPTSAQPVKPSANRHATAATKCASKRATIDRLRTSSSSDSTARANAASIAGSRTASASHRLATPTPAMMPSPPMRGVGATCSERSLGWSIGRLLPRCSSPVSDSQHATKAASGAIHSTDVIPISPSFRRRPESSGLSISRASGTTCGHSMSALAYQSTLRTPWLKSAAPVPSRAGVPNLR